MARLSFRQGIVRHQTDSNNNPTFLHKVGNYVSLIVSPDFTIINLICGTKDYLYTEHLTQVNAWGPFTPGIDAFLYWDINVLTGVRTFGSTTFDPVAAAEPPQIPSVGQMWFDTSFNIWYEWSGSSWTVIVRVFAAQLINGTQLSSMSIRSPEFVGTQVGLTVDSTPGSLVFDSSGNPIFDSTHKFFTTEDVFVTGVPTGASLKVNNILLRAQAQQNIAAYNVVVYSSYNKIVPALPFTILNRVYGITEESANINDIVNVITEGVIFNEHWDWPGDGADVNDPVFIDNTGQIVLSPTGADALPVGAVIGPQTILFDPTLYGLSSGSSVSDDVIVGDVDLIVDAFINPVTTAEFKFNSLDSSSYTAIKAADVIPADYTLQLPADKPLRDGQKMVVTNTIADVYALSFIDDPYDITFTQLGVVVSPDIITRFVSGRNITIAENPSASIVHVGYCNVAPIAGSADFTIYKANTLTIDVDPPTIIGTVSFPIGSKSATISIGSVDLTVNDHVYVQAINANGIEGPHITLVGYTT